MKKSLCMHNDRYQDSDSDIPKIICAYDRDQDSDSDIPKMTKPLYVHMIGTKTQTQTETGPQSSPR